MVLRYDGFADILESESKKDQEIQDLKEQVSKMRSLEDDIKSMREDVKNIFDVLWTAKQNDGRVGRDMDKTILDENRHITSPISDHIRIYG